MKRITIVKLIVCFVYGLFCMSGFAHTQKKQNYPSIEFRKDSIVAIKLISQIDTLYTSKDFYNTLLLIDKTIPFCEKLGFIAHLADLHKIKGDIYRSTDNYVKALEDLSASLEYYQKINDNKGAASVRNLIGAVYRLQGKYPVALEYYFEALKAYQSIYYKPGVSVTLNNIGIVYLYQKDYDKALEYYFKSLKLGEELKDEEGIGISYLNIGGAYQKKKELDKAIDCYLKSLVISKKINDLDAIGVNYNEIGSIYTEQNKLQQAKTFLEQALKAFNDLGSKSRQAECHLYLGQYYIKAKNIDQAFLHFKTALNLANETGSKEFYLNSLLRLSEVYEIQKNSLLALKFFKEYISVRDSMFNENNIKQSVQAEFLYQFERKQEIIKLVQAKKDAIFLEKANQQKIFRNFFIATLSLLIIFIAFIYSAYRNKRKANVTLAKHQNEILEKNEELLQQQEEILAQRNEIERKNIILERSTQIIAAKNERIISSIEYAKTIQQAILPHEEQLSKYFKDHFVIFLPKDIVSGDFFWFSSDQDNVYAAVIDCTGHGVPGSFMSLIGNTLLNQIVNEWHYHDPAFILENLHQNIRKALQQDEIHSKSHASMDICFVKINLKTLTVNFAGANRPLYIIQNGNFTKIPGDKKSAGGFMRELKRTYTNHEIQITSNSFIYLTTDGFIDQMNPEKRKFGPKQLIKLLVENSDKPMNLQKDILINILDVYKQSEEQIDDICILGLKI